MESTADSNLDYAPPKTRGGGRSATPTRYSTIEARITPHPAEDYGETGVLNKDPTIRLLMRRIQKIEKGQTRPRELEKL